MFIDLGAEQMIAAEKAGVKIAVEIKSFLDESTISAFHEAIGQYDNYSLALEDEDPERQLYLAVLNGSMNAFFKNPLCKK